MHVIPSRADGEGHHLPRLKSSCPKSFHSGFSVRTKSFFFSRRQPLISLFPYNSVANIAVVLVVSQAVQLVPFRKTLNGSALVLPSTTLEIIRTRPCTRRLDYDWSPYRRRTFSLRLRGPSPSARLGMTSSCTTRSISLPPKGPSAPLTQHHRRFADHGGAALHFCLRHHFVSLRDAHHFFDGRLALPDATPAVLA
jgi:hypothetical protein